MSNVEAIKKADNAPDRIWATVNGMSTRYPDGSRQLIGGWQQDDGRGGAVEYVRASTLEALQRENERLQAEIDRKSSMPGDHRYWEGRYRDEAAENEKLRSFAASFRFSHNKDAFYQDCYLHIDNPDSVSFKLGNGSQFSKFMGNLEERRLAALASAGEEHHAE